MALAPTRAGAQCNLHTDAGAAYLLAFPDSLTDPPLPEDALLVVMGDVPATVAIGIPACNPLPILVNPAPGAPARVHVCDLCETVGDAVGPTISVNLVGNQVPILHVVLKHHEAPDQSDDAYLAIPTVRFGNRYRSLSHRGFALGGADFSRFTATILVDGTELSYVTCDGSASLGSGPLLAGDSFQRRCPTVAQDFTGRLIESVNGEPFGLVAGTTGALVPFGRTAGETLWEMMPPDDWGGTEYLGGEFNKENDAALQPGDIFRVMATQDATDITVEGVGAITPSPEGGRRCDPLPTFTLDQGDWCDVYIKGGGRIFSPNARPFLAAQYMKGDGVTARGDPSYTLLLPTDRYVCKHRFFSFGGFDSTACPTSGPPCVTNLNGAYVTIVAPATAIATTTIDGMPVSATPGCGVPVAFNPPSAYSWVECRLPDPPAAGAEHVVEGRDGTGNLVPVAVYVYGQRWAGAYAYPASLGF